MLKELGKDHDRLRVELRDIVRGPRVKNRQNCEAFKDRFGWCPGLTKIVKQLDEVSLEARTF